jgi:hypothetical protein
MSAFVPVVPPLCLCGEKKNHKGTKDFTKSTTPAEAWR